jgi:3D (Asp-Asp-Asp) domain-containing protein
MGAGIFYKSNEHMKLIILIILLIPNKLSNGFVIKNVTDIYEYVTVTTYTASTNETDSTPLITASGFKLDSLNPAKHRIIAVSRDLKSKWKFGTRVKILNAGIYNGVYQVLDVMNKRFKNRIDILINADDQHTKLENIKILKL